MNTNLYRGVRLAWAPVGALAMVLLCSCGTEGMDSPETVAQTTESLVNGTLTSGHTATVAVYHGTARPCSGVYLGNRWVMTARHCTDDVPASQMYVTSLLSPGPALPSSRPAPKWRGVSRIETYPTDLGVLYGGQYGPDIALLKLDGELEAYMGGSIVRVSGRVSTTAGVRDQTLFCQGYGRAYNIGAPDDPASELTTGSGTQRQGWFVAAEEPTSPYAMRIMNNAQGQSFSHGDSGGPCFVVVSHRGGGSIILAGISEAATPDWNYMRQWSVAGDTPYSAWIDQILAQ